VGDRGEAGGAFLIREGGEDDHPFVLALGTEAFVRFGDYDPILREFLARSDVSVWIAEAGSEAAGFALLERPAAAPGFADLVAIAVDPRRRRQGVARALLAKVVAVAGEGGGPGLLALTVADDNQAAVALFRSFGFAMVPGTFGRYAGGQTSRRMIRTVRPRSH
jgi:ribosomal protein S18 acetylase RimI-like enzyme